MKEFFGIGGYTRPAEGYMSWQHLLFVGCLLTIMTAAAVFLGIGYRHRSLKEKNRVLIIAALAMDAVELFKIVMFCIRSADPMRWLYELPLFLCSILLIAMPLAAFSKGRVREASLDFVCIFGLLGALLGTIAAGNNYAAFPVLSIDNVASGITHCLSGFGCLYIFISGMVSMQKKNILLTFGILLVFCVAAYTANVLLDGNYMFLMRGDGTPYDILFNLTGGSPVLYPICVVLLFLVYILVFYKIYYVITEKKAAKV